MLEPPNEMSPLIILGIRFLPGNASTAVDAGLRGGLIVVPSAPVLVEMSQKPSLRDALIDADMAIPDSSFMVLIWWFLYGEKLERVSGLEYLEQLLRRVKSEGVVEIPEVQISLPSGIPQPEALPSCLSHPTSGAVLWVMPNDAARARNLAWLRANGHATRSEHCYVAPIYQSAGPLSDRLLLEWVRARRPRHIIICLGGGVQERLGYFLKRELEQGGGSGSLPGIHCVGAAIGFLSGDQVRIPMWADYFYLGWFFRCISAPRHFVPRYWKAVRLVWLLWRYGKEAPPA